MDSYRSRLYSSYVSRLRSAIAASGDAEIAQREPYLQALIDRYFPKRRDIAVREIGAGYGAFLYVLEKNGYTNLLGYDRAPGQIGRSLPLRVARLEERDIWDALRSTPGDSVDVMIAFDILEHFTKEEALRLSDEVRRVLKLEGFWLIHCPNAGSPFGGRIRYGDLTHEMAYTRESISQLLHAAGFDRIDCREDAPVIHGPFSFIRWVLWQFIRAALRFYIAVETGSIDPGIIFSQNLLTVARRSNGTVPIP